MLAVLVAAAAAASFPPRTDVCIAPEGNAPPIEVSLPAKAAAEVLAKGNAYAPPVWYLDADGDGYGDPAASVNACVAPAQMVSVAGDCDDSSDRVHPGAAEQCGNGIDEDCSGEDLLCSSDFGGWRVTSGRIEPGSSPGTITGSFTLDRLDPASPALRPGGACYVADLGPHAPCNTDDDCIAMASNFSHGFGYCVSPDGSNEPKACWIRPGGDDYCTPKGLQGPGTKSLPQKPAGVGLDVLTYPRWMILSCLSELDPVTRIPGCASRSPGHYVYSKGPAEAIPPSP